MKSGYLYRDIDGEKQKKHEHEVKRSVKAKESRVIKQKLEFLVLIFGIHILLLDALDWTLCLMEL